MLLDHYGKLRIKINWKSNRLLIKDLKERF
jgi:hypothetical protein